MRLALLGYYHETNTFAVQPTDYTRFVRSGILRGAAIEYDHAAAQSTVAGFLDIGGTLGVDVVPWLCQHSVHKDGCRRVGACSALGSFCSDGHELAHQRLPSSTMLPSSSDNAGRP